jgi:hypothetical protein
MAHKIKKQLDVIISNYVDGETTYKNAEAAIINMIIDRANSGYCDYKELISLDEARINAIGRLKRRRRIINELRKVSKQKTKVL